MERDCCIRPLFGNRSISTHTLTWSVTVGINFRTPSNKISTHTLTWSVTIDTNRRSLDFIISTHTLTWSVTILLELPLQI